MAKKSRKRSVVAVGESGQAVIKAQSNRQARRVKAREAAAGKTKEWVLVAGILAVTFVVFLNSLSGEFVYDDRFQIQKNPTITDISNLPKMFTQSVWQFMSSSSDTPIGSYYRPVFNIALILNYQFFKFDVFGWHLFSLLLHLAATYLMYRLARQWGVQREVAAAAALLFGVHPAHVESVAWVSGSPDPFAAVFILASLILYERYYHDALASRKILYLAVAMAFLAMLSKEVAIAFPVFLAIKELLERAEDESLVARVTRAAKRAAPFVIAAVAYMALRYAVLGFISKAEPKAAAVTTAQVIFTIPSVLLKYVRMLFIPYPLAITYPHEYVSSASDPRFWASALALAGLFIGAALLTRSSAVGRKALLFMILFMLPVLNLKAFNHEESLMHDRYLYLPSAGFCILVAMALWWIATRFKDNQQAAFQVATALITVVFMVLTFNQNYTWQNDLVMANAALKLNPQSPFLLNYVGAYYSDKKDFVKAEQYYRNALANNPQFYDSHSNLGDIYLQQQKWTEAEQLYVEAVANGAPYSNTYYNLGVVRTNQNNYAGAEEALVKAVEIQPNYADALYNLGWICNKQGKTDLAEQMFRRALAAKPTYIEPRIELGNLLTKQGRYSEADQQLQMAKSYAPDHSVLLYGLGDLYMRTNRHQDAIPHLAKLAQREPRHQFVHTMLGLCYEAVGNKEQAKSEYQQAIQVAPQEPYTNVAREHLAKL